MTFSAVTPAGPLDPRVTSGTWYVTRTSLPLWRHLDNPSVTYAALPTGQIVDTVRATTRLRSRRPGPHHQGHERLILGLDTPLAQAGAFEWRGLSPLTRLARSRWQVLAHDPDAHLWAVTLFGRTPFTPAGLDIYSRAPRLLPDLEAPLLRFLATLPAAAPHLPRLFAPRHAQGCRP